MGLTIFIVYSLALALLQQAWAPLTRAQSNENDSSSFYAGPGVTAGELLRARGFLAEEKYFTTTDNYVIRVTRGRNPLINNGQGGAPNRVPILFVHGILEADNVFLINSFDAAPRDWSNLSLVGAEGERTARQLAQEPSAKALPLLALNLGHEVWVMSRRGFPGSQELLGDPLSTPPSEADHTPWDDETSGRQRQARQSNFLASLGNLMGPFASALSNAFDFSGFIQQLAFDFDRKFWDFSFDEQARWDLPQAINFVLQQTGRPKLSLVSHSAGGAIELMSLSRYPQLADKLESSILWSQGFSLGHGDVFNLLQFTLPFFEAYVGPVPPTSTNNQIQAIAGLFCTTQLAQSTLCEGVADLALGASAGQEPIRPEFINSLLYPTSSHEIAQNLQMIPEGQMLGFNYGPPYKLSRVRLNTMSFYVGATDAIVSPSDVRATLRELPVPYKFHLIETAFNHNGYFYHRNNSQLVILPSMREIHEFSAQQQAGR